MQLTARQVFSPNHSLNIAIYKTSLYEGCNLSSKLLPLVVGMWETNGNERLTDFYSFDSNGICLVHTYSRRQGNMYTAHEMHDTDVSRLKNHGEVIEKLLQDYPIPAILQGHTTVIDLCNNMLR